MGLFSRKPKNEVIINDKEKLDEMLVKISFFKDLLKDNEEAMPLLKEIEDKIKYTIPTSDSKLIEMDNKILNKLGDFKIYVQRLINTNRMYEFESIHLEDIKMIVLDRISRN